MARSSKVKVMISSRNLVAPFAKESAITLSAIRQELKTELERTELLGSSLFEVWINEGAAPAGATEDSWEKCMKEVADCDILLVLYDGHAGWTKTPGEVGICHAELMIGLSNAPAKVRLIQLPLVDTPMDKAEADRNLRFQEYTKTQSLFRGASVSSVDALKKRAREALHDAVVGLAQAGVREASKGKFYSGAALDWSRLNFTERRSKMERVVREFLRERPGAIAVGLEFALPIGATKVCFRADAMPAAFTVAAAREMVGQPFLGDHSQVSDLEGTRAVGPVHLIACQKTVTEAQALRLLGFPDATVVSAPFGVYIADDVQKIQMVLLANCRDETTTRHGIQRFLEWLDQSAEAERLASRARSRTKIIKAISVQLRA